LIKEMSKPAHREKDKQFPVTEAQSKKMLQQLRELSSTVGNKLFSAVLAADKVTDYLEKTLNVKVEPIILYQGKTRVRPPEVSLYLATADVMQRDMRIEVPCNKTGGGRTVLFARSWIDMNGLDEEFGKLLCEGKMTIGQIIRERNLTVEYRNLGYKKMRSAAPAGVFSEGGNIHLIRRSRMILYKKKPAIFMHEFVPYDYR